jgi:hypothetical protein
MMLRTEFRYAIIGCICGSIIPRIIWWLVF